MAIIRNERCPECAAVGRDSTSNHAIVFEDGGKLCNRSDLHESGYRYYQAPTGQDPILDAGIDGRTKYSPEQFQEIELEGKLKSDFLRHLALSGMRQQDQYEVMSQAERDDLEEGWRLDKEHFDSLRIKHLIDRQIHGKYAKLYNVKVGLDANGKVARHYYPRYEDGEWIGAKCRTLPKDFRTGHLGRMWGDTELFGEHTLPEVLASGRRMHTLLLVGGEADAMAAQEMLTESQKGTRYEGQLFHVWGVSDGESAIKQILRRRDVINQFNKVLVGFDDDEVGQKLNREVAKIFNGKVQKLPMPPGSSDPNDALKRQLHSAFVNSWWNPCDVFEGVNIKSVSSIKNELKQGLPATGCSWPWPSLNPLTLGIRENNLILYGAGSGVGKTEVLREVVKCLVDQGRSVGVINTEDPYTKVARSFIGKWIDKRIELPPNNDPDSEGYRKLFDYTEEDANDAIDYVSGLNQLWFADLTDSRSIESIMEQVNEMYNNGCTDIVIDNLTGIEVNNKTSEREGIDEALKTLGMYKDSKKITIHLVSHLKTVGMGRTTHEEGGEVYLSDFRGSRSIGFWASYALAVQRNTQADTMEERTTTYIKIVKDRDQGIHTGKKVTIIGDEHTGRLVEPSQRRELRNKNKSTTVDQPTDEREGDFA